MIEKFWPFILGIVTIIYHFFYGYREKLQGKKEFENEANEQIANEMRVRDNIKFNNSLLSDDDRARGMFKYQEGRDRQFRSKKSK